jgi:sortase A
MPWLACVVVALVLTVVGSVGWIVLTARTDRAHLDAGQGALTRAWDLQIAQVDVPAALPEPGGPIGRMFIPRLKLSWIIAEGVDEGSLAGAPGHFPATADPGERGNFALAGHREVGMFADLDQVREHDKIVVETRQRFYVYAVVSVLVTLPNDLTQLAPTPPGMSPGRLLTLMTCAPRWDNTHRLWVHAVLERTSPRDEIPPELTEGDQR